jgi:hypothetical protein
MYVQLCIYTRICTCFTFLPLRMHAHNPPLRPSFRVFRILRCCRYFCCSFLPDGLPVFLLPVLSLCRSVLFFPSLYSATSQPQVHGKGGGRGRCDISFIIFLSFPPASSL